MTQTIPSHQHRGYPGYGTPYQRPCEPAAPAFAPHPGISTAGRPGQLWGSPAAPPAFSRPIPAIVPPAAGPWGPPNTWPGPSGWPMPPVNAAKRKTQWWLVGAAGVATVATVITATVAMAGLADHNGSATTAASGVPVPAPPVTSSLAPQTTVAAPAPGNTGSLVDDETLPTLLPDVATVGQVMGGVRLEAIDRLSGSGMFNDQPNPPECAGLVVPVSSVAYSRFAPRTTLVQALRDQNKNLVHTVFNGVTTFSTQSAATAFVNQQAGTWQGCRANPIVLTPKNDKPMTWTVRDVAQRGDTLTASTALQNSSTLCQRALTAKRNVVIDITTCSENPGDTAATLAAQISQRLGQSS
ncbi:sensor domain-containing protein [Mycobacterium sp. 050128]|uniref:sensor domain-containing protein n=1 Tax=unclassified Mycobacterium TaxID=2642494 RepID=UPI002ED78F90